MIDMAKILACLLLLTVACVNPVRAHYPHDSLEFVALSPDYANDRTVVIGMEQAWSTRPNAALVSTNGGDSWASRPRGLDNLDDLTSAIVSPAFATDKTVFLASRQQGAYRSTDGGASWEQFSDGLDDLRIGALAAGMDGAGGVSYFVLAGDGGLFRLLPGESTWSRRLGASVVVTALAVSPGFAVDGTVIAGSLQGTVFRSTDGGTSFTRIDLPLLGSATISRIAFAPDYADSGELFIGTTAGLFVSDNYLAGLERVNDFPQQLVSALALSPDYRVDSTLFATTATNVYQSSDRGVSWSIRETGVKLVAQTSVHFRDLVISSDFANDGTVFLATFEGLIRSTDYGSTWVELETRPPALIMDVAMSPAFATDGLMAVSTYGGGLYVSEDGGNSWRASSIGVSRPYTYQLAIVDRPSEGPLILSSRANHLLLSGDRGNSWVEKEILRASGSSCLASEMGVSPDFALDSTVFFGCRRDGIVITRNGGDSWSRVVRRWQLDGGIVTAVTPSPDFTADTTVMFSEYRGFVARSSDAGANWQATLAGLPPPGIRYGGSGLAYSPDYGNDDLVAAATSAGLYLSADGGSNWSVVPDTNSPVASGVIENVAFSPDFASDRTMLVSVRGQGLFRSVDAGLSWQQAGVGAEGFRYDMQKVKFSPDFAVDGIVFGFGHDRLYRSLDRGVSFQPFDLPFTRYEESHLQAVMYGGSWRRVNYGDASGTSFRAAATSGHEVSMTFVGTGIRWIGARANTLGTADVYLDGVLVATVDQYSDEVALRQVNYAVEDLPSMPHELKIVVRGERNSASQSNWIVIDAFDVMR